MQFFPTAEGYLKNNPYGFEPKPEIVRPSYVYNYLDHLGNVRLNYYRNSTNIPEILEENNYYPFGLVHKGYNDTRTSNGSYQYKYNNKEYHLITNMYDYGVRFYMPDIGRWGVVDPLAEKDRKWTPYRYAYNNPLRFIDPDGRREVDNDDIIIRGTDKKEWRVVTAGEDKVYNVPFALKNNATLDVGIGNVDLDRFAVGYTVQGDLSATAGVGGSGGVELSVVQFTNSKYSGYNYVYAGVHEQLSVGAQFSASASVGGSISIAYNTSKDKIDPTNYAGITSSVGVSVDAKFIAGGGVNVNMFSGSGKQLGWKGVSLGVSIGVGAGANLGSANATLSKTWLINDVRPTSQRSMVDRVTNAVSPITSALATGTLEKIKQNRNIR
ncbi:MAG: RHS repeat-associated core domain-containing protein [Cruoricaptor ignavus]|nr:RHS repeat-associated core domain-containing protein [Cruoricaptor ignavus]